METSLLAVTVTLALLQFVLAAGIESDSECVPIQYLHLNDSGIIRCSFKDYAAVTWYSAEEDKTILVLREGVKSGQGYSSGQYDIFPNGSLFIQHVTLEHEALFRVLKVISIKEALSVHYDVHILTVVQPQAPYPVIDRCAEGKTFCFISVYVDSFLNCVIENSRPSVNLTWISRSLRGDQLLDSSYTSITYDNITYTSNSTVEYAISQLTLLNTFVCQANSNPRGLIEDQESVIVIDKVINYKDVASAQKKYVELHSSMELPCSNNRSINNNREIMVWKQLLKGHDTWSTILFTSTSSSWLTESYKPEFEVDGDGTLLLESLQTDQEGFYTCIFNSGANEDIILYDVTTYVHPLPPYLVVEGCDHQEHCVLHVANGDGIKCSIIGIRPEVELEWIIFGDIDTVSFEDKRYSVKQNKDLFDVTLTSIISYSQTSEKTITVACRVTPSENHQFHYSTTIDIQLIVNQTNQSDLVKTILIIVAASFLIPTIITIALILKRKGSRRRREQQSREQKRREEQRHEANQEELSPLMYSIPLKSKPTGDQNNEDVFIEHLQAKYKILYDSVQPIPYIKDRMYCVDKVFVESGIEYLLKSADARQKGNWKPLESYHELLGERLTTFDRSILEGEPGYGKSTVTLQLAYDWCNSVGESPLSSIKMLLFLRLRQLGGIFSIYEAIKRFIIPKDSTLTEEDVKQVVEACNSVVIVLDGYDEYPDQDNKETDISKIISKDIFRKTKVVLTTRSSYLPKHRVPQYSRIRLLGFDESARDKYIRKAVVGDDDVAAEHIKRRLRENPVLGDLCEVPLFFVMFAHITHENRELQTFKSVTEFFRYMIKCFHSHMRNKMEEENVNVFTLMETEHAQLDKIAFKALAGKNQQIVWKREELLESLGTSFYDQYVKVGILVEDEIVNVIQDFQSQSDCTIEVRFYHKLFCEWYAAHYLAKQILKATTITTRLLANIDPYDLQYLYRFACGISKDASDKIIKYLRKTEEGKKFAILCILEQEGETNFLLESVTELVSEKVNLSGNDSRLLQRSTIQIVDFASKKGINVPCLVLEQCVGTFENKTISLLSGVNMPPLHAVEKILVNTGEIQVESRLIIGLAQYGEQCSSLTEIRFHKTSVMPLSLDTSDVPPGLKSSHVPVYWRPFDCDFRANIQSGQWEVDDIDFVRHLCSNAVSLKKEHSQLKQWSIIQLLKCASNHNVSISCVNLDQSLERIDKDEMILTSGITLPKLLTLEKINIKSEEEEELTEDDVINIRTYALQSKRLKELSFGKCLLPLSFSSRSVSNEMINRNVKVTWCRYGYRFNFQSGLWEVDDVVTVRRLCSSRVDIKRTDSKLLQKWTIQLLKNASDNGIPIIDVGLSDFSPRVNKSDSSISLNSGLSLPVLNSLKALSIYDFYRTLTNDEFVAFLRYSSECTSLKELWFWSGYTLPETVPPRLIPPPLIYRNVKVIYTAIPLDLVLKFDTGKWEKY